MNIFDPIQATDPVVVEPKEQQVYDRWVVARLVIEYGGAVRYTMRRADSQGNIAPPEIDQPVMGQLDNFWELLSTDQQLADAAGAILAAVKSHAQAAGKL